MMNQQQQEVLIGQIEQQADIIVAQDAIIGQLRAILGRVDNDPRTLADARIALSDWLVAQYPHLYPGQGRPHLRLIEGGGEGTGRLF